MDFRCKVNNPQCGNLFLTVQEIIEHFKSFHRMKEKSNEFICPVNNDCAKQFLRIQSLKNHTKMCIVSRYVLFYESLTVIIDIETV